MYEDTKKEKIKASVAMFCILLIIAIVFVVIIKYSVEGEVNMPFKLSKITIISTAEGMQNEGSQEKWNINIFQTNDIYFTINKNENYKKQEIIQSVSIENISITNAPKLGNIVTYIPNSLEGRTFVYSDEYILEGNSLKYKGATKTDTKNLEIGNQGGTIAIRFANSKIGNYISNEEEQIVHNGTLISKVEQNIENIKFDISFDLIIAVENKSYKSTINLSLPLKDIIVNGSDNIEINGNEFVFKRI